MNLNPLTNEYVPNKLFKLNSYLYPGKILGSTGHWCIDAL